MNIYIIYNYNAIFSIGKIIMSFVIVIHKVIGGEKSLK